MNRISLTPRKELNFSVYPKKSLEESYFDIFSDTSEKNIQANFLQQKLNHYYKTLMSEPKHFLDIPDDLDEISEIRAIENAWNKYLDSCITNTLPQSKNEFRSWYASVNEQYKTSVKSFFNYFSQSASLEELALYLIFEQRVDGSFDDIVSLAQIGVQGKAKMVLAENYWDEMGNGNEQHVHTTMFSESLEYLKAILEKSKHNLKVTDHIPTAILANGNMLLMYANRRKFIPRLLGAITILEDTAPDRFKATVNLMKRYNLPEEVIRYHEVHVHCDCRHGEDLLDSVLIPAIMDGNKAFLSEVCKGVLIRLNIATEYYKSMKNTFDSVFKKGA